MSSVRSYHERGGIILTTPGFLGLGIDGGYYTLVDFGGHREAYDEDLVATACREAHEESFGLLSYTREDLLRAPSVATPDTLMFFVPYSQTPFEFTQDFTRALLLAQMARRKIESCAVFWIPWDRLETYLSFPELWYPPVHRAVQAFALQRGK